MVTLVEPDMQTRAFTITGTEQLVLSPWTAHGCCGRAPGKPRLLYETDEWAGIPSNSIRAALVRAAQILGGVKSLVTVKLSIFVESDGFDRIDGTPLVQITKGAPGVLEHRQPHPQGAVRRRARWDPGWEAEVRVRYASAVFTTEDISNLITRVGIQVGLGEGRPDSRSSSGMGWGTFSVKT